MFISELKRENVKREIDRNRPFQMHYRLMLDGNPVPVILKIVSVQERDGEKWIAGIREWKERQ